MEKLTFAQRKPLFDIIERQRQNGQEAIFVTDDDYIYDLSDPDFKDPVTEIDETLIGLWQNHGYIYLHRYREVPHPTVFPQPSAGLRLSQQALDYYDWMRKPRWQRWFIEQARAVSSEIRAAVVSLVTALVTSVLTLLVLKWLGLT